MRLEQYMNNKINEKLIVNDYNEMIDLINRDCKPFLKEFEGTTIYRGTKDIKTDNTLIRVKSRTNRKPKDTPRHLHDLMDELFKKYHGWKARSEGVFVTKDYITASDYGKPALFYPISDYKYLWSETIDDLYFQIQDQITVSILGFSIRIKELLPEHITPEFKEMLEDIIKTYKLSGFKKLNDNECMFKVKNYYLIRFDTPNERLIFANRVSIK